MSQTNGKRLPNHCRLAPLDWPRQIAMLAVLLTGAKILAAHAANAELASSYRFLVSDRDTAGGILYTATAGNLQGRQLPLSFIDSAAYWGEYVCRSASATCAVTDSYNAQTYTLTPQKNTAGDLQTERINIHNGSNIYDTATWQIAVMLGAVRNRFAIPNQQDAYALASNQNQLLREGYSGASSHPAPGQNRATTNGNVFVYQRQAVTDPARAYAFRTLARNWLAADPFIGTRYAEWLTTSGLPAANPEYRIGTITWTDWKPISGENAWAFLIGPLQAAYIHYASAANQSFVPFQDSAVQNALALLPTFAAMQAPLGAVYYAPAGTVKNQGEELIDPYEIAVENSFSLYAGLKLLRATLQAELARDKNLTSAEQATIRAALRLSAVMIDGGAIDTQHRTVGLRAFFKNSAWRNGEFVQGGVANDPARASAWIPTLVPHAVDVNTWGVAALGARQIDEWFGNGAAYRNWQQLKSWGAYGIGKTLWGVGYSDRDGNGIDADGNYRPGVFSTEWTAGAITMLRNMIAYYRTIPRAASEYTHAQHYVETLTSDEQSMLAALQNLRIDNYSKIKLPGQPANYSTLLPASGSTSINTLPYLYASKRYLIPFGWYANPLPSTCSTAWVVMLANHYDPFGYGGETTQ